MRAIIDLLEAATTDGYDPQMVYLHGGPAKLIGNRLQAGPKGGIFLIPESDAGYKLALGYAILRTADSGIWRCHVTLTLDEVFDYSNSQHRDRLAKEAGADHMSKFDETVKAFRGNQLPWTRNSNIETWNHILTALGFKGCLFAEKRPGGQVVESLCVLDANNVKTIDFLPKADALARYGS